jgi:hypothetical protein
MAWSAPMKRRVLIAWPRRRQRLPARPRVQRSPYRDVYFANPDDVENDYLRLRRRLAAAARGGRRESSGQLLAQGVREPRAVPAGGPAPVDDKQPVHLGGHERVNHVGSFAFRKSLPK